MFEVDSTSAVGDAIERVPTDELAALLGPAQVAELADADLIDHIAGWERLISWATARQGQALVELAHRRLDAHGDGARSDWQDRINEFAIDEVALALCLSRPAASRRFGLALALDELPGTREALRRGQIDPVRARVIAEGIEGFPEWQRRGIEAAVLPQAAEQTAGQLRSAVARAAIAADPAAADRRHEAARAQRRCELIPLPDGMALLRATLPAPQAVRVWAGLDERARSCGSADQRSMDQRRADALVDLVSQPEVADSPTRQRPGVRHPATALRITISAATLAGHRCDPGYLAGYGFLPPEAARRIGVAALGLDAGQLNGVPPVAPGGEPAAPPAAVLPAEPSGTKAVRAVAPPARSSSTVEARVVAPPGRSSSTVLLTRPVTGELDALVTAGGRLLDERTTTPAYAPPRGLVELIEARDVTCRFPGCRQPARRCDIDHVVPHPRGPTSPSNLVCLCRHHHRLKQSARWRVRVVPGGLEWITPAGQVYLAPRPAVDPAAELPMGTDWLPPPDDEPFLCQGDLT